MDLTMKIKSFLKFLKEEQNEGVFVGVKPNEYTEPLDLSKLSNS